MEAPPMMKELWFFRNILKLSWIYHMRNEDFFRKWKQYKHLHIESEKRITKA